MPIPCQIDQCIQILWDTFVHPETSCAQLNAKNTKTHRQAFPKSFWVRDHNERDAGERKRQMHSG